MLHAGLLLLASTAGAELQVAPGQDGVALRTQQFQLRAEQVFVLAEAAQTRGDLEAAAAMFKALLKDRSLPIRNEARFRYARILVAQGLHRMAAVQLRHILDEQPDAAVARIALAQLLVEMDDEGGALKELRAAQAGGLPPAVARLVDRFSDALRRQRPFGSSLEVALAPDSNITRATRSDTLGTVIGDFEIEEDSKAVSGTGLAVRGQVFGRLSLATNANLLARVSGLADLYAKSEFNQIGVDVAAGPEVRIGRNRLQLELGATQRWFGKKLFQRSARAALSVGRPLGRRTHVRIGTSAGLIDNQLNDLQDGRSYSGDISLEHALSPLMGVAVTFGGERQALRDDGYSTRSWRAGLTGWRDVGRMTFTAGAEFSRLAADERLSLFPDKREDRYTRLSLGATFRQFNVRGFAPLVRVIRERNRSSISIYDYQRTRTEIGISRAF